VWTAQPVRALDWFGRIVGAFVLWVSAMACWLAALAFVCVWIGPSTSARVMQVLLGLVVVPGGLIVGWVLLLAMLDTLRTRTWRAGVKDSSRFAEVTTVGRRVDRGTGWVERIGSPWTFVEPTVSSFTALVAFPTLRRTLLAGRTFLRGTPSSIDLLVLMALVRMARAGQIEVTREVNRFWVIGNPTNVPRTRRRASFLLRRGPSPEAPRDLIEALILRGLAGESAPPVAEVAVVAASPYRAPPSTPADDAPPPPWTSLPAVLARATRTYTRPRRSLRDAMRDALRREGINPSDPSHVADATAAYTALLTRQDNAMSFASQVLDDCVEGLRPGAWQQYPS